MPPSNESSAAWTLRERIYRWTVFTDGTWLVLFGRWPIRVR